MSTPILSAARYACELSSWSLADLQLQKILYIAQMVYAGQPGHLRLFGGQGFEAWDYGPVNPMLHRRVSCFGARPIKQVFRREEALDPALEESKFLAHVVGSLYDLPPWRLVQIVLDPRGAWARCYRSDSKMLIPHSEVVAEYARRFPDKCDEEDLPG
jgi:uncharacterized phage-associated protein